MTQSTQAEERKGDWADELALTVMRRTALTTDEAVYKRTGIHVDTDVATSAVSLAQLIRAKATEQLRVANASIERLQGQLEFRDRQIEAMQDLLHRRQNLIYQLDKRIADQEAVIREFEDQRP